MPISTRRFAAAAAAITLVGLHGVAAAQTMLTLPKRNEDRRTDEQKQYDAERKKALDDAYKKAGESIPEPKTKFDPWKNTR
jgi:hypothetical protein